MLIYKRGDLIPETLRDHRFIYKGKQSKVALIKYWRLLENERPDPDCKPFLRISEIELVHRAYPTLGPYLVESTSVGRPATGFDRKKYDKNRYERQKSG
jgi:hypothetical protein